MACPSHLENIRRLQGLLATTDMGKVHEHKAVTSIGDVDLCAPQASQACKQVQRGRPTQEDVDDSDMDSTVASPIQFRLDQDDILWKRDAEVFFKSFRNGVVAELASLAKQSGEDHEAWAKKIVGELEARISVSSTEMLFKQFQRYDVRVQERFAGIEATIGGVDERFAKQEQDMAISKTRYAYGGAGRSKSASLNLDFAGSATNDASIASCELPAAPTNGSLQEDESVALGGTSLPTSKKLYQHPKRLAPSP